MVALGEYTGLTSAVGLYAGLGLAPLGPAPPAAGPGSLAVGEYCGDVGEYCGCGAEQAVGRRGLPGW